MSSLKSQKKSFQKEQKNIYLQRPTACLVVIGDEILTGRTQDLHVQYLGKKLFEIGIDLKEVRIISDEIPSIVSHLNKIRSIYTYVFTTGGIGPTHDDKTAEAVALAFNVPLEENKEALDILKKRWKGLLSNPNQRMARMPKGVTLIENVVTQAPGFQLENVYVFAGVPSIMQAMFMAILPTLKGGVPLKSKSISCLLGEGSLASFLEEQEKKYPTIQIGSYPFFCPEGHGTTIVLRGKEETLLEKGIHSLEVFIKEKGGAYAQDPVLLFQSSVMSNNTSDMSTSSQNKLVPLKNFFEYAFSLSETRVLILGVLLFCLFIIGFFCFLGISPSQELVQKEIECSVIVAPEKTTVK